MVYFQKSVRKDELEGFPEIKNLFAQQFSKAYFNIGIIYDQKNETESAMNFYEKAYQKIMEISSAGTEQAPSMSDPTS